MFAEMLLGADVEPLTQLRSMVFEIGSSAPFPRRRSYLIHHGQALPHPGLTTGPTQAMALMANKMEDVVASDRSVLRVDQLARRLDLSIRSLQRLSERYIGLPPLAVIRRYRLQEAAQRLREDPSVTVAQVAAELDYADHAHLTADFRRVLGLSPSQYRQQTISDRQALSDR